MDPSTTPSLKARFKEKAKEKAIESAVEALSSTLKAAAGAVIALIDRDIELLSEVNDELLFLRDDLNHMDAFCNDLAVMPMEPGGSWELWMNEVEGLAREIAELTDETVAPVVQQDSSTSTSRIFKSALHHVARIPIPLISGYLADKPPVRDHRLQLDIADKIRDLKNSVERASKRRADYGSLSTAVHIARAGGRSRSSFEADQAVPPIFQINIDESIGIEDAKQELTQLVHEENGRERLKVISVVGNRGIGKTMLAMCVFESIRNEFPFSACATISRNFDPITFWRNVLMNEPAGATLHQLITRARERLTSGRYFILIDDVRTCNAWENIKSVFPRNSPGSVVMVTTRDASVVGEGIRYPMRNLEREHAASLLNKKIFGSENGCPDYLMETSEEILNMCDGVPLKITTVATNLRSDPQSVEHWRRVVDTVPDILREVDRAEDENEISQVSGQRRTRRRI